MTPASPKQQARVFALAHAPGDDAQPYDIAAERGDRMSQRIDRRRVLGAGLAWRAGGAAGPATPAIGALPGGRIAYNDDRGIWTMAADGTHRRQLTPPRRDGVSYRMTGMWLDDAEARELSHALLTVLQPRLANAPTPGRKRWLFATVTLPGSEADAS